MDIYIEIKKLANPEKAKLFQRFFKTGTGEYGEGDQFLGLTVPEMRSIAKKYQNLGLKDLQKLLSSKIHEHRLVSLFVLIAKYKKAEEKEKIQIVNFYLKNTANINNWDLVDLSAAYILGPYFFERDKKILYDLAKSKILWEKRISIISTFWFIKNNQLKDSLKIAEILLGDKHDLIHKAVGWMLREIGKKDQGIEEEFLKKHYKNIPRTTLRYAIERFPEKLRKAYLAGQIE